MVTKDGDKFIIEYEGKSIRTKHYKPISNEDWDHLKIEYYKKPNINLVTLEINKLFNGGKSTNNINDYFFKDLMSDVILFHSLWSINDIFECKDIFSYFYEKININDSFLMGLL